MSSSLVTAARIVAPCSWRLRRRLGRHGCDTVSAGDDLSALECARAIEEVVGKIKRSE
jgi:hypothetical protein